MTEEDGTKSLEHVSKGGYSIGPSLIQVGGTRASDLILPTLQTSSLLP